MNRPNVERLRELLSGRQGWAIARRLEEAHVKELLDYIKYLEEK